MWQCSFCDTVNADGVDPCACCGRKRASVSPPPPPPPPPPPRKRWWIVLLAAAALLAVGFFTVHIYAPATCTEPRTCYFCGRTVGAALGHNWGAWVNEQAPTCLQSGTQVRTCSRDRTHKETKYVPPIGHDWTDWTVEREPTCTQDGIAVRTCRNDRSHSERLPIAATGHEWTTVGGTKTCRICGATEGGSLIYVGDMDGYFSNEELELMEDCTSHPFVLDAPQHNVASFTLHLCIDNYSGDPFGYWTLFASADSGWDVMEVFEIRQGETGKWLDIDFDIGCWDTVYAFSIVTPYGQTCSVDFSVYFDNLRVYS